MVQEFTVFPAPPFAAAPFDDYERRQQGAWHRHHHPPWALTDEERERRREIEMGDDHANILIVFYKQWRSARYGKAQRGVTVAAGRVRPCAMRVMMTRGGRQSAAARRRRATVGGNKRRAGGAGAGCGWGWHRTAQQVAKQGAGEQSST
uniref:Uncharacterized protein n=1 Tax=Oryza sativa subsp. japonica TaxID=39947 RepID=Q6Z0J2_ORYSJ|nr:hypothetical protein [Oryza sativa Japonica Group]